jgi:hypothetical protein
MVSIPDMNSTISGSILSKPAFGKKGKKKGKKKKKKKLSRRTLTIPEVPSLNLG